MIYIGLDDTDNLTSRGTGRLARTIAAHLAGRFRLAGVTRHQLLVDPRVPYTSHNSSATIHLDEDGDVDLAALADEVQGLMLSDFQAGSDPGLCVVRDVAPAMSEFGRRAQREVVAQPDAHRLASAYGSILRGLGGTCDGVIGALAGVGLAAGGEDGRYLLVGTARDLEGDQSVPALLAHGISEVRTLEGRRIEAGCVETHGKLRPARREARPILFVEPHPERAGCWLPLKLG